MARPAAAQQAPADYEAGLFQLTITNLPGATIPVLLAPDGTLLFPLGDVLDVGQVPVHGDSAGYTVALLDEQRHETVARVDTVAGAIERGGARVDVEPGEMVRADGDVYLTAPLLAMLLHADVAADFATLELRISPSVPMPAQLAAEAERRRQLALLRAEQTAAPALPAKPLRPLSGAGVLHFALSSAYPEPSSASVLALESGFAVAGGLAAVGYAFSDDDVHIDPRLTFRYERYIPGQDWISFVRAGDVVAEGAFFRSMRGLTVTNRPLRRVGHFQDIVIDPEVPAGYEVEIYQGGQLIAFSDRATQDALRVPLTYGRTDLEVRMIAPSGEIVTTDLLYGVPQAQLPADAFEYSAGAGQCHVLDCTLLFAAADYGVTRWLTLGAGYEAQHDSTGYEHIPFGRASLAPAGGWLGDLRVIGDRQASATMQYTGFGPVTGSFGLDVRSATVPRATLLPQTRTRIDARGDLGFRGHRATGRLGGMEGAGVDRWGVGYIASIPRGVLMAQVDAFSGRATELSLSSFQLLPLRLAGASLTGSARVSTSRHGVRAIEGGVSASWENALFGNLTIGWDRDAGPNVGLSFSRLLPLGQVAGTFVASDGVQRMNVRADGAVAVDPFVAVEPAAYTGVGFAGIDAFVFRDLNRNGRHDEGEPPAAGVAIQAAGQRSAVSDSTGHARIWGLQPWEPTVLRAAPEWFEPQWAPSIDRFVIRPVAHVFNPVEVPLVATREFIAYLVAGEGIATTAGVAYRLVDLQTGTVREGLTLSDGSIYLSGMPTGEYLLEFDADDLEYLRARPVGPIRFTIGGTDSDEFVAELDPIVLQRAAP